MSARTLHLYDHTTLPNGEVTHRRLEVWELLFGKRHCLERLIVRSGEVPRVITRFKTKYKLDPPQVVEHAGETDGTTAARTEGTD